MNLRKWVGAVGVLAASVAVAVAASTPASAAEVDGWTANLGTTVEAVDGANVLVMDQAGTSAGTSLERVVAGNVHVELPIGFTFKLDGPDARCGGGAPRVYLLGGGLYGQLTSCPEASAGWMSVTAADLQWWSGGTQYESWTAAVAAHQGTPLGQVGLVFDNAAGQQARALFKDVVLAGDRVNLGVPTPTSPATTPPATGGPTGQPTGTPTTPPATTAGPSSTPTGSPSPTASESESGSPSPDPTVSTVPASGGGGLPLTGASVLGIGGVAGLLIAAGGLLFLWARRRREPDFEA